MSYAAEYSMHGTVAEAQADVRVGFIRRTYATLAGAVGALILLETILVNMPGIENLIRPMMGAWWLVMLVFMGVSWVATKWAESDTSIGMQYLGLALYTVLEALIILPLLYIASVQPNGQHIIAQAGILTFCIFGGLTGAVFFTKRDYSYLAPTLSIGGWLVLGFIVAFLIFPMSSTILLIFCFFVVALLAGTIIYQTSNVIHHYRPTQHVAAALALFSSVATLFYYILYIIMLLNDRD
jgi:hypothetical protein